MQLSTQASKGQVEWSLSGPNSLWKIQGQRCQMNIELLNVENCPNRAVALERLRAILSAASFHTHVNEVLVRDPEMTQSLKFPGSPTIRVNGQDVEPQIERPTSFGLMCRLYSDGSGAPSQGSLRAAIEKARGSGV
jgi:hypothetical protein